MTGIFGKVRQHVPLASAADKLLVKALSRSRLAVLRAAPDPRIGDAVHHAKPIEAIERERARLSANDTTLSGGPYDAGETVRSACGVSKPPRQAALLHMLARAWKPAQAIELGTNVGISSAYIASGMEGTLVTLEASPSRVAIASDLHERLGLRNIRYVTGLFADTLDGVLRDMRVDFAFIDGHHQYEPTLRYFEQIAACATPGALIMFDDIRWSDGMRKAWAALSRDRRFGMVVDLGDVGVCVMGGEHRLYGPIRAN